ncbi:UNVERIFIED_CONTAM: hypothetical protein K2H54_000166 [Gekko kuhli]
MFDGGFVSAVTLLDPDGQVLFQKVFHTAQQNVPTWLPSVIDMPPVKIEQELTDGWRMLGTLTLEGHTGYAYQHLWNAISRTGTALLAGLLVFTLVISWVCNRLLRPLEQINQQLDLKELVASVNQLVSERKRDLLQQRLKISQLSKQVAISNQPLQTLTEAGEGLLQQHFFSTQGSIRLYSRLIPEVTPSLDSSPDEIRHLLDLWSGWPPCRNRAWRWLSAPIPMTNETFNQLDPINPVFISCQPSQAPLYWNLVAQCLHSAGYTLLAEAGDIQDIDTLRNWGIDGYASKEA